MSLTDYAYLIKFYPFQEDVYTAQVTHISIHSSIMGKLRQPGTYRKKNWTETHADSYTRTNAGTHSYISAMTHTHIFVYK